jgi:tetratricopeptide (TPR) repeat protein
MLFMDICNLDQHDAESWIYLGTIHKQFGKIEEAEKCLNRAIGADPRRAETYYELGEIALARGRPEQAAAYFTKAQELKSGYAEAINGLGEALKAQGKYVQALACLRHGVEIRPDFFLFHYNLGKILVARGHEDQAADEYRRVLRMNQNYVPALLDLGYVLTATGNYDEATACYRKVQEIDPVSLKAVAGQADLNEKRGDFEKCRVILQPYLESGTVDLDIVLSLARICHRFHSCAEVAVLGERVLTAGGYTRNNEQLLHFELGAIYDRLADYDKAFEHYSRGNALAEVSLDPGPFAAEVDMLITAYSVEPLRRMPSATRASERPVFVVGMPRSGTSLVEQILASHPLVHGAGELLEILKIVDSMPSRLDAHKTYPKCVEALTQEFVDDAALTYLRYLEGLNSVAQRVVDKLPHNFLHLGLIQLLFPHAHVIHCIRDSLDTCLSCYFQNFGSRQPYSYDLAYLGRYYREYRRLMDHWKKTLSLPILDIQYEELISDQEAVSRKLVAFCGLDWDDRCLRFHETKRTVSTASYDQVRRPLYKSSVHRWKNYEKYLGPLKRALTGDP